MAGEFIDMSDSILIEEARRTVEAAATPAWLDDLRALTSANRVFTDFERRLEHSRDRLPLGRFLHRSKRLTATMPSAVVQPIDAGEVTGIMKFAGERRLAVIPYGSGSGVLGGTVCLNGELVVDFGRMDRIVEINETDGTATVEAGMNGGAFEAVLKERGFTCGHYPQSIHMSTVGGWAACRGAGQASSRYGNIEDMIVGMKVVLPDGELLEVRPVPRRSVGPSIMDIFIGSEGTLGMIVELTFRIWRVPAFEIGQVIAFPGIEEGLEALRRILQAELRPSVVRLYDPEETRHRGDGLAVFDTHPVMCIFQFSGHRAVAEAEGSAAIEICREHGAELADDGPYRAWQKVRFDSYSDQFVDDGWFFDTIEIAAPWSAIPAMYERMREAVLGKHPMVSLTAHWSHVYSDGVCMYMTAKIPPMPDDEGLPIHADIWETVMRQCLERGGTIAHHHGVGYFRNKWLVEELNAGHGVLRRIKQALDPQGSMNPGKLGFE
jgi:alkyldihydroxyacetonephosphate synthase